MYKLGIKGKLWRLLKCWYNKLECKVKIQGHESTKFEIEQGVFQGARWSMRKFQIFYSDIIKEIENCGKGCRIYQTKSPCSAWADDLAILAPYIEVLQWIINKVAKKAQKWKIQFNAGKSAALTFPPSDYKELPVIMLGNETIPWEEHVIYLGTGLGDEQTTINEMIKKGNTAFNALLSLGSKTRGISPALSSKLYNSNVLPSMTYGIEILCLSDESLSQLEAQLKMFGKRLQHLPKTTSNPATYSQLGWMSITAHKDKKQLCFIYNTLHLSIECIFKHIVLDRLVDIIQNPEGKTGPIAEFIRTCRKYNILHHIHNLIESATPLAKET